MLELEWMLGQAEAVSTKIRDDPKPKVRDVLFSNLKISGNNKNDDDDLSDSNDW